MSSSTINLILGIGFLVLVAAVVIIAISQVYTDYVDRKWKNHDKYFKALKWQEEKFLLGQPKPGPLNKFSVKRSDLEVSEDLLSRMSTMKEGNA